MKGFLNDGALFNPSIVGKVGVDRMFPSRDAHWACLDYGKDGRYATRDTPKASDTPHIRQLSLSLTQALSLGITFIASTGLGLKIMRVG